MRIPSLSLCLSVSDSLSHSLSLSLTLSLSLSLLLSISIYLFSLISFSFSFLLSLLPILDQSVSLIGLSILHSLSLLFIFYFSSLFNLLLVYPTTSLSLSHTHTISHFAWFSPTGMIYCSFKVSAFI